RGDEWKSCRTMNLGKFPPNCKTSSTHGSWLVPLLSTSSNAKLSRKMTMRKGEIWRAQLPFAPGHVQAGERPVLIIQNDAFSALPTVLVVPFTGTLAAARFGGTLVVPPDGRNGLTPRAGAPGVPTT